MRPYNHFKVATYLHAYDLAELTEAEFAENLRSFREKMHLDKIYIENHRGIVDIPMEKLRITKALCESCGLQTAGGITYTQFLNGVRKPAIYDTFCYTDPIHRREAVRIATELASVFDEIILDDFFFTACRCEMCIDAKGSRSWKEYRLALMEEFSRELIAAAKAVNPALKFVIKFPNWYESYQECGYYPEKQKDLFDGIYTGTETRTTDNAQHLQRYESYSIMRFMENIAPGRNGGGWVDLFGSLDCTENLLQQMEATVLGGAKELTLWNFQMYRQWEDLPVLGQYLYGVDQRMDTLEKPLGIPVWEPFNADAEEQIYNYLGMCGTMLNPTPYFDESAPAVLCTAATAEDPTSLEKLKQYVRQGGNAIVTLGYYKAMYDKGIRDFSSVTLTGRHVLGRDYRIQHANYYNDTFFVPGTTPVLYEVLDYKTNATHCNIAIMAGDCNFPLMTEDNYGKGRFFLLNLPENFADTYCLPAQLIQAINKHLSMGLPLYAAGEPKFSLYAFGNQAVLRSYAPEIRQVEVILRGKSAGLRDVDTGKIYTEKRALPLPSCMGDAATVIPEPAEYAYEIPLEANASMHLERMN